MRSPRGWRGKRRDAAEAEDDHQGEDVKIDEAKAECERWFRHLQRQKDKAAEMGRIALDRRNGAIDESEVKRRVRALDNCSVTVFDGANLEKAVRALLKHVR